MKSTRSILITAVALFTATATYAHIDMIPRPTDEKDFPEYIQYLVDVSFPRTAEERQADDAVMKRYKDAHNIDSIFIAAPGWPAGFSMGMYDEYVQHTIENNFTALSTTVSNGSETSKDVFERIATFNKYLADRPKKYMQIRTLKDFEIAKKKEKIGIGVRLG